MGSSSRSRQDAVPSKPAGLAGSFKATIMQPAAADEDDEPDTPTETEEIDDDLEYSGGSTDTLVHLPCSSSYIPLTNHCGIQVSISSTAPSSTAVVPVTTTRPGVRSLPQNVQRSFSSHFIPYVVAEMGCSTSPWSSLDVDTIQGCVNFIYSGYDYAVEHGDAFHSSVSPYVLSLNLPQNPYPKCRPTVA